MSTDDYLLGGGNEDSDISKEAPGREFLYSDHGHTRVADF